MLTRLFRHPEFLEDEDDDGDVVLRDCGADDDDDDNGDGAPNGLPPHMIGSSLVNGEK